MKIIYSYLCFLLLLTACSNNAKEEESNKNEQTYAQFTISETDYDEDTEVTRSNSAPVTQRMSLGNGLEAEMTLERDTAPQATTPHTRASEISNQHYTIYAVKNGVRVGGVIKGTFSGSGANKKFTPDAGTSKLMRLEPGEYTFVCYNDKVTDNGTSLSITRANATEALIGTTKQTISGDKFSVHFAMKRQAARVRIQLQTYWPITNITGTLVGTGVPGMAVYQADASQAPTSAAHTSLTNTLTYPADTEESTVGTPTDPTYTYNSQTAYHYFLPSTNINQLSLHFTGGTLYQDYSFHSKSLANVVRNMTTSQILAANSSYRLKVRILYSANMFLKTATCAHSPIEERTRLSPQL